MSSNFSIQNITTHTCEHCKTTQEYPSTIMLQLLHFVCAKCQKGYTWHKDKWIETGRREPLKNSSLTIGMKATFDNEGFMVVGAAAYRIENSNDYFQEFLLVSEQGTRLFLSESNYHWVKVKEIGNIVSEKLYQNVEVEGMTFKKIYDYSAYCVQCIGLFDYPIFDKTRIKEYIKPPAHLIFEDRSGEKSYFKGHYLSHKELKSAFEDSLELYETYNTGTSEPFYFNINVDTLIKSLMASCFLIFFINLSINSTKQSKVVYEFEQELVDSVAKKIVVSPSFLVEGHTSPLELYIRSNVNNNWVEYGITLINEDTREERDFDIGVEQYSGIESGEAWSEGSRVNNFTVCSVAPGRYHLELLPQKGGDNPTVTLSLVRGEHYFMNVVICFAFALGSIAILLFMDYEFERSRWRVSPFRPEKYKDS